MASEILLGEFPEDKAEYDALNKAQGGYITPPTFTRIIQEMMKKKINNARVAIVGRLYTGGRFISGFSAKMNIADIRNANAQGGTYEQKMQALFGLNQTPMHITGISIKPL